MWNMYRYMRINHLSRLDIIEMAEIFDSGFWEMFLPWGVRRILESCAKWSFRTINETIETRKEDIKGKKPGAIFEVDEQKILWIEASPRPTNNAKKEIYSLVSKFNGVLHEIIQNSTNQLLKLETISELKCFDVYGHLISIGKEKFWKEFDHKM